MATKKTVTMIYKHLNFQNDRLGKSKLLKSLAHSLRISPSDKNKINKTKALEWDEDLAHTNLIFAAHLGSKPVRLDTLTEEQKVKIQTGFIGKINYEQKQKDSNSETLDTLRKYKAKVNKWSKSITDNTDPIKIFLDKILDEKSPVQIESEINTLTQFEFARKNQKTETVRKFLELHNEVIENKSDISRNKIFIQEAFFKIPSHNNVNISTSDLVTNIHSFYKDNFPDYPVKLIVFHGDEVGNHPHIFIDAKNQRTGKYDLLTAQKNFVNDNIEKLKDEYPDAKRLDFSERDYSAKKLQAQYFQTLFYQHSNKMLNKYDIEAKKLEKTKENNARMALIEADAKKPKIEREYSFFNAKKVESNKDLSDIQKAISESRKELCTLNGNLPALRDESSNLKQSNIELKRKNEELTSLSKRYDKMKQDFDEMEPKYNHMLTNYQEIVNKAKTQIKDGIREILTVMWGLQAWGKEKFTFGMFNKKMKGEPNDLKEFDESIEKLVRLTADEALDTYIDIDFLTPKEPIAQSFKAKVIEERNHPERRERKLYIDKEVDIYDKAFNTKKSNVEIARELFDEHEIEQHREPKKNTTHSIKP